MSSESDPLASPPRHLLVLGLSPPLAEFLLFNSWRYFLIPLTDVSPSTPVASSTQVTSSTFFATSSPNLVAASSHLSALFPRLKRTPQPWATEKSGTCVSDELVLLDFFNLLLSRLPSRSPLLFDAATHRLAVDDQIPLLLSAPLLLLSPPQRNHLQHLLRHLVAQSRDGLLPCERIVYRHGAVLLILHVCSGFNPRRCRH